jgi:hypothetical protein
MESVRLENSKRKYFLLLLVATAFVVLGVFIIWHAKPGDAWIGWLNIGFFGLGILLFAWQLFDRRPRITIDANGVFDRTLGVGIIPWNEITGAYLASIHDNAFICLELSDPEFWLSKLSRAKRLVVRANKALGFAELNLNLSGVNADADEVLQLVLRMSAQHGGKRM